MKSLIGSRGIYAVKSVHLNFKRIRKWYKETMMSLQSHLSSLDEWYYLSDPKTEKLAMVIRRYRLRLYNIRSFYYGQLLLPYIGYDVLMIVYDCFSLLEMYDMNRFTNGLGHCLPSCYCSHSSDCLLSQN